MSDDLLPLPAAAFHILVALAESDRHGYAIMQEVAERTGGRSKLNPGTLYTRCAVSSTWRLVDRDRESPRADDRRRTIGYAGGRAPRSASWRGWRSRDPGRPAGARAAAVNRARAAAGRPAAPTPRLALSRPLPCRGTREMTRVEALCGGPAQRRGLAPSAWRRGAAETWRRPLRARHPGQYSPLCAPLRSPQRSSLAPGDSSLGIGARRRFGSPTRLLAPLPTPPRPRHVPRETTSRAT